LNGIILKISGRRWHLIAEGDEVFLQRTATVMRLQSANPNDHPKIVFCRSAPGKDIYEIIARAYADADYTPPKDGWRSYDFRIVRIWHHPEVPDRICEFVHDGENAIITMGIYFALYPVYLDIIRDAGLPFHAALVEKNGRGVLLAGAGNTGKSTCCRRIPAPWNSLCDDESVILRGNAGFIAHPFPTWSEHVFNASDKSWDVSASVPADALYFLEQSDRDFALPLEPVEAAIRILNGAKEIFQRYFIHPAVIPDDEKRVQQMLFHNACELAKSIRCYRLFFSRFGAFWEELETGSGVFPKTPAARGKTVPLSRLL
jgi:SynChlorMet cassette protein ScmC